MEPDTQVQTSVLPQKHFINRVTTFSKVLAVILFITLPVVTLYIGYQQGIKKEIPSVVETNESNSVSLVGVLSDARSPESQAVNKVTITTPAEKVDGTERTGSDRIFTFTNRFFSIVFAYPNDPRYVVQHWESGKLEQSMKSVQVHFIDANTDETLMSIYEQDSGYCYLGWCELKAKETLKTAYFTWEYLGSTSYADAGESSVFENLYRTQNGDFTMYVVTKNPIDLTNDSDVVVKAFESLHPGI